MSSRSMLPLVDLVFLTLGVIVAVMTQMQRVTALPVEMTEVAPGAAELRMDPVGVLVIDHRGVVTWNGQVVPRGDVCQVVEGDSVVVRSDRRTAVDPLFDVLAELRRCGVDVSVEVDERPGPPGGA